MNTLTDEQLQLIADKGASAAHEQLKSEDRTNQHLLCVKHQSNNQLYFGLDAPARVAFARTVIDLALSKMAEGEGDLLKVDEVKSMSHGNTWELLTNSINTRHRQAMAALRAQMQGEIDRLEQEKTGAMRYMAERYTELETARDQWKERAEKAEFEVARLTRAITSNEGCIVQGNDFCDHGWMTIKDHNQRSSKLRQDWQAAEKELAVLRQYQKEIREQQERAETDYIPEAGGWQKKIPQLASQQAPADREAFTDWWANYSTFPDEGYDAQDKEFHMEEAFKAGQRAALAHKPQPWIACSERLSVRNVEQLAAAVDELSKCAPNQIDEIVAEFTKRVEKARAIWLPIEADWKARMAAAEALEDEIAPTAEKVPRPPCPRCRKTECTCPPGTHAPEEWGDPKRLTCGCGNELPCPHAKFGQTAPTPPEGFRVTFTNGTINPPPYGSWHRSDWSPEMLPDGWRPFLLGEDGEGELFWAGKWEAINENYLKTSACGLTPHNRTRRPLPPAPEKEKEPEWVELGPDDVPPNAVFRHWLWNAIRWFDAEYVSVEGVGIPCIGLMNRFATWSELFDKWEISRDNGKTWEACKKIKQP